MSAEDRSKMSVMLTCKDMKKSVRFYRDQLGFHMKESWPDDASPQWCNMVLDRQSVMLGAAMDAAKIACPGDPVTEKHWKQVAEDLKTSKPGVGIRVYVEVPDVDAYAETIRDKGVHMEGEPKTQFYGIRDIGVDDPDGYRMVFFSPVVIGTCQSCGMPLQGAEPGQMYCSYCTDENGRLRPYEQILEGTISGYFMAMKKMPRKEAEKAAREHLAKMPTWAGH